MLAMLLLVTAIGNAQSPSPEPSWQIGHLSQSEWGNTESKGYSLYTTAEDTYGIAFRCQKKRLYTIVAAKKITMADMMLRVSWKSKKWTARYSIDGGAERDGPWISFIGGRMFMAVEKRATDEVYSTARRAGEITFTPKRGKSVVVEIPEDTAGHFARFEALCGL